MTTFGEWARECAKRMKDDGPAFIADRDPDIAALPLNSVVGEIARDLCVNALPISDALGKLSDTVLDEFWDVIAHAVDVVSRG